MTDVAGFVLAVVAFLVTVEVIARLVMRRWQKGPP